MCGGDSIGLLFHSIRAANNRPQIKEEANNMTFTFRVYYEDDSFRNYGKKRSKLVRAKNKEQAMERFRKKYGIDPLHAV